MVGRTSGLPIILHLLIYLVLLFACGPEDKEPCSSVGPFDCTDNDCCFVHISHQNYSCFHKVSKNSNEEHSRETDVSMGSNEDRSKETAVCPPSECRPQTPQRRGQGGRGRKRGRTDAKFNANFTIYINNYRGPVVDLLEDETIGHLLPLVRMKGLVMSDLDQKSPKLFNTLPDAKKLTICRQTLLQKPTKYDKIKEVIHLFKSKGCSFVPSVALDILAGLSHTDLGIVLEMTACSEKYDFPYIPAKMEKLCEVISRSMKTFTDLKNPINATCALCLTYMMRWREGWRELVLADQDIKRSVCDKIGNSYILDSSLLSYWAGVCTEPSETPGCPGLRPSFMANAPSPPSAAHLAACKDVFCSRLCQPVIWQTGEIRKALRDVPGVNLGCLAYLTNPAPSESGLPKLNGTLIPGSCKLRSEILNRALKSRHRRKKRSCTVTCENIEQRISLGIDPPDVLDAKQIETCLQPDGFPVCVKKNDLGDYRWNHDQALALFNLILQSGTFEAAENWSSFNLEILGFIGLGFTPEELSTLDGVTDEVYASFGAAYGWSPQQLRALAQRYLVYHKLQPSQLTNVDLARLKHLVCGFSKEQIQAIRYSAITDTTPILGTMRQCLSEALLAFAERLLIYYGPVNDWPEEYFSEFGILLAGLSGDRLKKVGPVLARFVTVPFITHIPPYEFMKLSPDQTTLFSYEVVQALSKRGLCAWLNRSRKPLQQSNVYMFCNDAVPVTRGNILVLVLSSIIATAFSYRGFI